MKIVYTGGIYANHFLSTCLLRMQELQKQGHDVTDCCVFPFMAWGGRWLGYPFRRLFWGPPLQQYNQKLQTLLEEVRPDVFWVDKGQWVYPETLQKAHRLGIYTVHYTPDPALTFHKSRWFRQGVPLYDLMITTKPYEVELYQQLQVKRLLLKPPMFIPSIHRPQLVTPEAWQRYACDAVFIGTYAVGRERYLLPLLEHGFDVAIWGSYWERCKERRLRACVRAPALAGLDYSLGIQCATIGMGLLSPLVPDTSTTRSVEIPAIGTFLLAERTQEHLQMFVEGVEAEFFDNQEELLAKATHYINYPEEREAIAQAGQARCFHSGYGVDHQLRDMMALIQEEKEHRHTKTNHVEARS